MAGIYIHIPFCKSRCIYCGFYSTTGLELRQRYIDALCHEWLLRQQELKESLDTIYLGGGTPSQLTDKQLQQLFAFLPIATTEVTIECNPDDVSASYAATLAQLPINRVSMGVQTFDDQRLNFCTAVTHQHRCYRPYNTSAMLVSRISASISCMASLTRHWTTGSAILTQLSLFKWNTYRPTV